MADQNNLIVKARTKLILNHPFFGSLLLSSKMIETPGTETIQTDGIHIYYDPTYINKLKPEELQGELAHNVCHKMFMHSFRLHERNPQIWESATDFVINGLIKEAGMIMPEGAIQSDKFKDKSADEVYKILYEELQKQQKQKSQQQQGSGSPDPNGTPGEGGQGGDEDNDHGQDSQGQNEGQPSDQQQENNDDNGNQHDRSQSGEQNGQTEQSNPQQLQDAISREVRRMLSNYGSTDKIPQHLRSPEPKDAAGQAELEHEIKTQIAQAAALAKEAGKLPGSIKALIGEILEPKVDWKKELRDFLVQTSKTDYTFKRPNRRMMAHDLYMPSLTGLEMPPICIMFDTSGSIFSHKKTVDTFVSEINSIIEDCVPEHVDVIYVDTRVAGHDVLEKHELLEPNLRGGGGTAFSKAFKYVNEKLDTQPAAVIFFTDLYVSDFGECDLPVLWCVYDNPQPDKPPFGQILVIEDD